MGSADIGSDASASASADTVTVAQVDRPAGSGPWVGSRLGRYVVVEAIGQGGMGRVLRAYDPKLRREVALKLLRADASEDARARIVHEAQAMAQLSHPNIVSVFDVDVQEIQPYIAMEYVEGKTLRAWLGERQRSWREVVGAFVEAGRGLAAAHGVGIVHRDFKLTNVLVGGADTVRIRVMDFGLARAVSCDVPASDSGSGLESPGTLTQDGVVVGTPAFMAPEQHAGGRIDARTDQYAFCIALWEGLYGQRPFAGKGLLAQKRALAVQVAPGGARVPARLRKVLLRGLAPRAEDRFPDIDALLLELARDPRRRRRLLIGAGSAVILGTGYAATTWWQRAEARQACADEGGEIADEWGDDQRAAVRERFEATDTKHAADSFQRAVPWVDAYARDWAELRTRSCVAARVEGGSEQVYQRVAACLDERRSHLAARVAVLMEADAAMVRNAVSAAASLPAVSRCGDERAGRVPLSNDLEMRAKVLALSEHKATVNSLLAAARMDDAVASGEQLVARAEALGDEASLADARYSLGYAAMYAGDHQRARQLFEAAFFSAGQTAADEIAVDAAASLTYLLGYWLRKPEEALVWGRFAQMLLQRLDRTDGIQAATVLNNVASVHYVNVHYSKAAESYEQAIAIFARVVGEQHPRTASVLANLGNVYTMTAKFDQAESRYRRALGIYEEVLGPRHPNCAMLLNSLGTLHYERGQPDKSAEFHRRALAIYEDVLGPEHADTAYSLGGLANALIDLRELDEALDLSRRALAVREKNFGPSHPLVGHSLVSLGYLHQNRGDLELAVSFDTRAIAVFEGVHGPDHPLVADALHNLASLHHEQGDLDTALAEYQRALAIRERALDPDHDDIPRTRWGLGDVLVEKGDLAAGIQALEEALDHRERMNVAALPLAQTRFSLAKALRRANRNDDRAVTLARAAHASLQAPDSVTQSLHTEIGAWLRTVD